MKSLSKNWFIEDLPDFEYKKYILLAYLQDVQHQFKEQKLYPYLSDLLGHYRNLQAFQQSKQNLFKQFPERIQEIDIENLRIAYEKVMQDDELMQQIEYIVSYSIPQMKSKLDEGRYLFEFVEENMSISPVGILPLYKNEGYLMLKEGKKDTRVYEYQVSLFEQQNEKYRGVHIRYLQSYKSSLMNTYEHIKRDLIRQNSKLPAPATYVIEMPLEFPLSETVEPVAKRLLIKYISNSNS